MCDKQYTVIFLCVTSSTPLFFMCDKQDTVFLFLFFMCNKQDTVIFIFYLNRIFNVFKGKTFLLFTSLIPPVGTIHLRRLSR